MVKRYERCWKQDKELAARLQLIEKEFTAAGQDAKRRIEVARERLSRESVRLPGAGEQAAAVPYVEKLRKLANETLGELRELRSLDALDEKHGATYINLQIDQWRPRDAENGFGENYLVDQGCALKDAQDKRCLEVFGKALEIADSMFLVQNVIYAMRQTLREDLEKSLTARKERWHSYLYDSQFQYIWELGINRVLEENCPLVPQGIAYRLLEENKKSKNGKERPCGELARDEHGFALEWREPPSFRAIILHPEIGFMYKRDEPDGDRIKPSLVFQWFGYQWWKYRDSKVSDLRGLSIVSTVSDNVEGNAVGLGLQVQYDEYALALTSHGGKPVLTFSFALVDRASKLNDEWADKLRRLRQGP